MRTFIIASLVLLSSCVMKKNVDTILVSDKVYTLDSANTIARVVIINDGLIEDVGGMDLLEKYQSDQVLRPGNAVVYPGFIDAHCHFYGYGCNALRYADLSGCIRFDEVIERLKNHYKQKKLPWLLGRGWDQNLWPGKEMPDKSWLDNDFPDVPVFIIRIDGHAALVNSKALVLAGDSIGKLLSENARSAGLLMENELDHIRSIIPELSEAEKQRAIQIAQEDCFSFGLTSVADAGLDKETVLLMDSMQENGSMTIGMYAMLEPSQENIDHFVKKGPYRNKGLHVRSVKLYADGALGSRGACLLDDYADDPGNRGQIIYPKSYYQELARLAFDNGYQVNTHAIGDSANRFVLDLYAGFLKGQNDLRWRIEHAQVVHPSDLTKFGAYSIIPSIQSTHATSDMYWVEERLGKERVKYAYCYKSLLEQNHYLANGTDFPVEQINPIFTFYSACFRKDKHGFPESGFNPENALLRIEALKSMTIWAAKANFEEKIKGSIQPRKSADFTLLDTDLLTGTETEILNAKVMMTIVNGQVVYENKP